MNFFIDRPIFATVGSLPDALVIPQTALAETQTGTHVYVVDDSNNVNRRVVETGMTHGPLVVVNDGLKDGERGSLAGRAEGQGRRGGEADDSVGASPESDTTRSTS